MILSIRAGGRRNFLARRGKRYESWSDLFARFLTPACRRAGSSRAILFNPFGQWEVVINKGGQMLWDQIEYARRYGLNDVDGYTDAVRAMAREGIEVMAYIGTPVDYVPRRDVLRTLKPIIDAGGGIYFDASASLKDSPHIQTLLDLNEHVSVGTETWPVPGHPLAHLPSLALARAVDSRLDRISRDGPQRLVMFRGDDEDSIKAIRHTQRVTSANVHDVVAKCAQRGWTTVMPAELFVR
ncbi:MAG: hypothetical protein AAGD00_03045 [Planctomycetota bacterium]